jgi:sortase A
MRISAPEIGLDAIVIEGSDLKALALGPGHMINTAWPGQTGNAVITGHRDTFFRRLDELSKGDALTVQRNGRSFTYEVTDKRIVQANDMSVVQPTSDAELTLITCSPAYSIGPAPERLVVFTKRKDAAQQAVAEIAVRANRKHSRSSLKKLTKVQ